MDSGGSEVPATRLSSITSLMESLSSSLFATPASSAPTLRSASPSTSPSGNPVSQERRLDAVPSMPKRQLSKRVKSNHPLALDEPDSHSDRMTSATEGGVAGASAEKPFCIDDEEEDDSVESGEEPSGGRDDDNEEDSNGVEQRSAAQDIAWASCVLSSLQGRSKRSAPPVASSLFPLPSSGAQLPDPVLELSDEQQEAFNLVVKEGRSIFITGGAGTGKSHLLRTIIRQLACKTTFVTASTGIAALNLSGCTLHSFVGCGIPDSDHSRVKVARRVYSNKGARNRWQTCRTLIIDEVSMIDASFFELVDFIGRAVRRQPREPFGGVQLVLSGDFLQLPPVRRVERRGPLFCFETLAWLRANPKLCLLSKPFRQQDNTFFSILSEMRLGTLQPESIATLERISSAANSVNFVKREGQTCKMEAKEANNGPETAQLGIKREREDGVPISGEGLQQSRLVLTDSRGRPLYAPFDGYTILRSKRDEVDTENSRYYRQLTTEEIGYTGTHTGQGQFPSKDLHPHVKLRVGCRVMLIKNTDPTLGLANGSTGYVTGFVSFANRYEFKSMGIKREDAEGVCVGRGSDESKKHSLLPVVAFEIGGTRERGVVIEPQEWKESQGDRVISRSVQIPLILAYAITIHKSQGMSLSYVDIDFRSIFEDGQAYVALSRCRDIKTTRLSGFDAHVVSQNSRALAYYKALVLYRQQRRWREQHAWATALNADIPLMMRSAAEQEEQLSCTPYGYLIPHTISYTDGGNNTDDDYAAVLHFDMEKESKKRSWLLCDDVRPTQLRSLPDGDTLQLESLRRRITPMLELVADLRKMVGKCLLPAARLRNYRLVMDHGSLFECTVGQRSAQVWDLVFRQQSNSLRIPNAVMQVLKEAAAYAAEVQSRPSSSLALSGEPDHEASTEETTLLASSEVAAEALVLIEKARMEFVADTQQQGQTADLGQPMPLWRRFEEILPILDRQSGGSSAKPEETLREIDFLLNRDPRETSLHRDILEYAAFLRQSFGEDVAVCTGSPLLAASALSFGLKVVHFDG